MTTAIDTEAVVELAERLIAAPSPNPPGEEAAVVEVLAERLADSPVAFETERQAVAAGRPNLVARAGNPSHGTFLLTGHTDVVPATAADWTADPYDPQRVDGRLVGRGSADMKGALAAKLVAAEQYLTQAPDPGEVVLAFVVDEEHAGAGTRHLVESGIDADAALIGEPTELDVYIATKGAARYHVEIHGESCHSGQPDTGRDAIRGLRQFLQGVEDLDDTLERTTAHPRLGPEDVTVTEVTGGTAPNVVADHATATVDWRCHPETTTPERFATALADISVPAAVAVEIERTVFARGMAVDASAPLVETVEAAAADAGLEPAVTGMNAGTDARLLVHDAGIPTVHFGPGSIQDDAHTVDESVAIADLTRTANVYTRVLDRWFGTG